eukprot:scaffold79850_cov63-Phaeocystis_antarctica.AAC.1
MRRHALRSEALENTVGRSDLERAGCHAHSQAYVGQTIRTVSGDGRLARQQNIVERPVRDNVAEIITKLEMEEQ